ncbi:hypothetical protein S40293_08036 [Stachybotrys chartarum IBT 40293]|nr:hypothetical protein S40293_08036 [Stachybotrys chartarum IBT 40293]
MAAAPPTSETNHEHPVMDWLNYLATKNGNPEVLNNVKSPCPLPSDFPDTKASYWIAEYQFPMQDARTTPSLPDEADVVVIGAGIVGATAVYRISEAQPDLRVVLVEARGICTGATGRNGGHLSCHEAGGIRDLAERVGTEDAIRIRKTFRKNRDMTISVIEQHNAQQKVDLNLGGSLLCFGSAGERDAFIADIAFCKEHGWEPEGKIITAEEVQQNHGVSAKSAQHGAWYLPRGGTIYARKLVDFLITKASESMPSLNIQTHTPVTKVSFDNAAALPYTVQTGRGEIRTRTVLHATNAYARALIPELRGQDGVFGIKAHMLGVRSTADGIVQDLKPGLLHNHAIHYILQRPREQSGKSPVFLYGHGDVELIEDFNDSVVPADIEPTKKEMYEYLETALPQHFPAIDAKKQVEYDWSGIQGFTNDGRSIVGRVVPERPGEFLCVAHNGEGMSRCFVLSTITVEALLAHLKGEFFKRPDWLPHLYARHI